MATPVAPSGAIRYAYSFAIVLAVAEVALDLATWVELDIAAIYGVPLVVAGLARSRRLIRVLTVALLVATFSAYAMQIPAGAFGLGEALFLNRVLDAAALLLIAGLLHAWVASLDVREAQARLLEEQNGKLEAANDLLVARGELIVRQNEELTRRRLEAESVSKRKTNLLNTISHDIRNPAHAINLMAEAIHRAAEDPALAVQVSQMARRLQSNARSLIALVAEVLDIAYLDSGLMQRRDSTFPLNEFIETACRNHSVLAEAKGLYLEAELSPRSFCVRTDRIKLERIVDNLVTNGVKFTAEGGVTIRAAEAPGGAVILGVLDTGMGIAEDELDHIFDEFAQLRPPAEKLDGGWGLGLPICRRLADVLEASIEVESQVGTGSVFTVRLPPESVVEVDAEPLSGARCTCT